MTPQLRRSSLFPLILLSYSLACSGLQPIPPAHSQGHALQPASQKQALINQLDLFDAPAMKAYLHPSNMFSYEVPVGWTVEDSPLSVQVSSPTSIVFSVSWIDGGYTLSTSSFIKLASNTENTKYASHDRYRVIAHREDRQNRFVFVEKTYLQDGARRISISIYRQIGQFMYIVEMSGAGTEITSSPKYEELFFAFNESIRPHSVANLTSVAYLDVWTFTEAENRFSMDVPLGWEWSASEPQEDVEKTQFRSPDGNAVIDTIYWNPGEFINMVFAADYAFNLLADSYLKSTDDIKVISEIILEDGRKEKITWVSRSGGYAGVTYFEVRNRVEMRVLSFTWNRLFDDIYAPVMENAAATYELRPLME
jgi:hypothetical protein